MARTEVVGGESPASTSARVAASAGAAISGPAPTPHRRVRVRIGGTVQGVGFRPYVFRLARACELTGFVQNDAAGVTVEVEGPPDAVGRFLERLTLDAPAVATIERTHVEERAPLGLAASFTIRATPDADDPSALVAPDAATCSACLAELLDPQDRRYRYPFINCTHCGPRFTIIRSVPYDRPRTTMDEFRMCARCRAEYDDPADRRFHAQPNACRDCGPRVRFTDVEGRPANHAAAADDVAAAAAAIGRGAIVAVKGIGGFHLACRADDEAAVERLRRRKRREEKPFALMVADLPSARRLVELDAREERLLTGRERPIVLARRRPDAPVAAAVAPRQRELGVMLAYSPLHHLLLGDVGAALVMTSGNASDEPIAYRDEDARERLATIADFLLLHDRPIATRAEDSVARVVTIGGERRTLMLRRGRGFVPMPLPLPVAAEWPLLAAGSQQKNTFCLVRGDRAWVGQHVGDLESEEAQRSHREGIAHAEHLFAIAPRLVAHDLHPDYAATRYALDRRGELTPVGVQHHHAHLAACLAEHGETGPALGVIFDGTGYGLDGTIWGGELLLGDLAGFERVGRLWPVRMPGGAAAVREPWRMACAWLAEISDGAVPIPAALEREVEPMQWAAVLRLARSGLASPVTSSVGRLLDAIAAMCGLRARATYEGQAAIELEAVADGTTSASYDVPVVRLDGDVVLDGRALVRAVAHDLAAGVPLARIAAAVHTGLTHAVAGACVAVAERSAVRTVALSGGVFQNVLLLERTAALLEHAGFRVLVPERLPPNDGGLSYGQAAVAAFRSSGTTASPRPAR